MPDHFPIFAACTSYAHSRRRYIRYTSSPLAHKRAALPNDRSHEPADVLTDAVLAWRMLLPGGMLILDDYMWHDVVAADQIKCPKPAIDAFLSVFGAQLNVLELNYQCIVQKVT